MSVELESNPQVDFEEDEGSLWSFDPFQTMDSEFHTLTAIYGIDFLLDLDSVILHPPKKAAALATKIYQDYTLRAGLTPKTREVMASFASTLQDRQMFIGGDAILPEESLFSGFESIKEA